MEYVTGEYLVGDSGVPRSDSKVNCRHHHCHGCLTEVVVNDNADFIARYMTGFVLWLQLPEDLRDLAGGPLPEDPSPF